MSEFIKENEKLMHLDLTGCNLGATVTELSEALSLSRSLQAIHFSFNSIPQSAKKILFDTMRVNPK